MDLNHLVETNTALSPQPLSQVAFIDTSIADWQSLASGVPAGVEVVLLDSQQDGVLQMAEWAKTHTGYDAIHILSHGRSSAIQLGTSTLEDSTLPKYAEALLTLGGALSEEGDILVYGCNVAAESAGVEFIGKLAQATGADIAASDNLTGNSALGGDWVLEKHLGLVNSTALTLDEYMGTLALTVTNSFATGVGTPEDLAIDSQNNLYVVSIDDNTLYKYAASGGAITGGAVNTAFATITNATCVAIDTAGNLYLGTGSGIIMKYPASGGVPSNVGGVSFASGFNNISDIVVGSDGYLYAADSGASKVYKLPASGGPLTLASVLASATVNDAQQLYIDAANNLYATSPRDGKVIKFAASGGAISLVSPSDFVTGLSDEPRSITSDGTNFYIGTGSFGGDGKVYKTGAGGGAVTPENTFAGAQVTELFWAGSNTLYGTFSDNMVRKLVTPAPNTAPTITSGAGGSVGENSSTSVVVYTATATDAESDPITYELSGTDSTAFSINSSTGDVTLNASADYETKSSYSITINAKDGSNTTTKAVTINVTDVNEAPNFTSGASGSVAENAATSTVVYTATATDPEGAAVSYSLSGTDAASFSINSNTGTVTLNASADYETKNSYSLSVVAADASSNTMSKAVTINVTNVNEKPAITAPASQSVAQNTATALTGISVDDPDSGSNLITMSLSAPAGTFTAITGSGVTALGSGTSSLTLNGNKTNINAFIAASKVTYTSAAGATGTVTLSIGTNDGGNSGSGGTKTDSKTETLNISDPNTAPTVAHAISDQSASVNSAFSYVVPANTFADVDINDTLTYSATKGDGSALPSWLSFNASTRTFSGTPAIGDVATVAVKVTATDNGVGALSVSDTFDLVVSNSPTVSSIERAGSASATVLASATSLDYTVTFSQAVTGVDSSDFTLDSTGNAAGTISNVSGSGTTYTVTVNTLSGDGTLRLDLNSSGTGIQSSGSVAITGGYTGGQTYTLDHTAPTTTISSLALASDTGSSSTDFITKTALQSLTATLSAALAAGEKLLGSTDNGTNWTDLSSFVTSSGSIALNWSGLTLSGSSFFKLKVQDAAGNDGPVASQAYIYDNTAPTLTSSTPADEGTSVAVGSNIVLNFSEAIKAGTGNIVLHPATGSDITIDVTDTSQVSISGSTLTINPTADLVANTAYEVQIANGSGGVGQSQNGAQFTPAPTYALTDVAGNGFIGLASNSSGSLNFTTAAASSGGGGGGGSTSTSGGGTFDGVNVGRTTQSDGSTVISVPIVTNDRTDDPTTSNRTHADIPIVKDSQGNAVLTVSVPTGVGLNVEGQGNAITRDSALTDLIKRIEQKTDTGSAIQTKMKGDGQNFLNALTSSDTLIVQTITPTVSGTTAPDQPIIINGNTHTDGSKDALVIDASKLPSGTKLTLNNVAFAAIVGAVRVTGGEGQNIAVGDNEDQFIVLGADDDILYGGGGTDTVGSLGGNDQTFGDAGNDIVYGGTGDDTLTGGTGSDQYNGGLGTDTAILEGSLKDYTVKIEGQKLILTQLSTGDVDTLIDIEKVQFRDDSDSWTIQYQNQATGLVGDHIGNIQAQRDLFGSSGEEQGYLPMGFGLVGDAGAGYDQLNMEGARSDVHLEKNGNAVELTRLKDGAMLSLTNIEAIRFDNGDVTLFAHSQTEAILGRLFQTIINRDGSLTEWKVGVQALKDRVDGNVFAAWFHAQNTALQAMNNSDYVQQLYQNTYGRQATTTELSATLSRLDAGSISRDLLAVEIANSSEAITAVGSVMTFEGWV